LVVAFLLATMFSPAGPSTEAAGQTLDLFDRLRAADKALRWLDSHQNSDGGFGYPASDSDTTCEVVLAFSSAYEEPATVQEAGKSPLDYLATQVATLTSSAEGTALLILTVVAGNKDPWSFADDNLLTILDGYYNPSTGRYRGPVSDGMAAQALAIMAKQASAEPVPAKAVTWLVGEQNVDGGWAPLPGQESDTEHTALSVQALVAAGQSPGSAPVQVAIVYLHGRQTEDGGFASSATTSISDPVSTSRAIQALLAAGENLFGQRWRRCLSSPIDALLDGQAGDGSFGNNLAITAGAVPGLLGRSLPLPGRYAAALRALNWLHDQQQEDGGFGGGGFTADAMYAIALCGQDPTGVEWAHPLTNNTPLEALEEQTQDYIDGAPPGGPAGELSKVIRAVQEAGGDPRDFASLDLVAELEALYDPGSGEYHPTKIYSHDLALIALHAVSETMPGLAVTALEDAHLVDGGWPWAWGATSSDVDSTGLSMQAIVAGGGPSSPDTMDDGADFLLALRFPGGAYPDLATRTEPNCDSTSLAIQGLLASGRYRQEPLLFGLDTGGVASSWDALLSFQEPPGSFVASESVPESRLLATVEAVHALCSPLYPGYQPLVEGDTTKTETIHARLTCGDGLGVVAAYSGDDDDDGLASLRYHGVGEVLWSGWMDMAKGGLSYVELLDLEEQTEYEIEVSYADPDGVSGQQTQSMTVFQGKTCIPMTVGSYGG
jgi:prenyltransferase beta subunit